MLWEVTVQMSENRLIEDIDNLNLPNDGDLIDAIYQTEMDFRNSLRELQPVIEEAIRDAIREEDK